MLLSFDKGERAGHGRISNEVSIFDDKEDKVRDMRFDNSTALGTSKEVANSVDLTM